LRNLKSDRVTEIVNTAIRDGEETSPSLAVNSCFGQSVLEVEAMLDILPNNEQ
jgi:hypothetical protein